MLVHSRAVWLRPDCILSLSYFSLILSDVPKSARSIESRERSATVTDSEVDKSESTIARIKRTRQKRLDLVRKDQQSSKYTKAVDCSHIDSSNVSSADTDLSQWHRSRKHPLKPLHGFHNGCTQKLTSARRTGARPITTPGGVSKIVPRKQSM